MLYTFFFATFANLGYPLKFIYSLVFYHLYVCIPITYLIFLFILKLDIPNNVHKSFSGTFYLFKIMAVVCDPVYCTVPFTSLGCMLPVFLFSLFSYCFLVSYTSLFTHLKLMPFVRVPVSTRSCMGVHKPHDQRRK